MGEKCMDLKGGYTAMRLLDLNSGPSGSDTTGIIRPCSALSFLHLTSLESSFLYPAGQFHFSFRIDLEDHERTYSLAKSGWEGNFSIDSIRYWYESESPAIIFPINGMNWNEYCRYTLLISLTLRRSKEGSLSKQGICNFSKFKYTNLSTWFQYPICLAQDCW